MANLARDLLEEGIDVYSNIKINEFTLNLHARRKHFWSAERHVLGHLYYWESLMQFKFIHNGIVILDEAGSYFEATEWAKFDPDDRLKFQQHRKQELDIYLGVQNFKRVTNVIRDLTVSAIELSSFPQSSRRHRRTPFIFMAREYKSDDIELKKRKSIGTSFYRFDKSVADSYSTKQFVNLRKIVEYNFKPMREFFTDTVGGRKAVDGIRGFSKGGDNT